jgi:hypothetical protein
LRAFSLRDCSSTLLLALAAVLMIPTVAAEANAVTRDQMIFPLDARSAGMGQTGNADSDNIANAAFNPAIASMMDGIHFVWRRSNVTFPLSELEMDGVIAGGGHHLRLNESMTVGGGLAVGYAEERWGFRGFDDPIPEWGAFIREYNIAAGISGMYDGILQVGIGLDIKKWKWDNDAEEDFYRQITEATVWDAVGGELGILDILFFRLGRISRRTRDSSGSGTNQTTVVDTTIGFGIAVPFRKYLFRFDHAQRHFDIADVYQHLYSVLLEVSF